MVRILSIFLGLLGVDHFFLRSPVTGLFKLFTLGGLGLWWLWDIIQLFAESDRVLNYGMSAPLDLVTGIGQGMITDKKISYTTQAPYSSWIVGIIFGFIGLDSLLAKNGGQFLRKLVEFLLFLLCMISVLHVFETGITVGWVFAVIFASFFGSIIIAEYISIISVVAGGEMFTKGIEFTEAEDKQYNGFFAWLIKNAGFSVERQAAIVSDLQYGGIPANKLKEMFEIRHTSESTGTDSASKIKSDNSSSSWVSFALLMASPFLIIWNFIMFVVFLIKEGVSSLTPWYPAILAGKIAAVIGLKTAGLESSAESLGLGPMMKNLPVKGLDKLGGVADKMLQAGKAATSATGGTGGLAGAVTGGLTEKAGGLAGAVTGGLTEKVGGLAEKAGGLAGAVTGGLTEKAGGLTEKAGGLTEKAGGLAEKAGGLTEKAGGLAGAGKGTVSSLASAAKAGTIKAPSLDSLSTIQNPLLKAKAQHGGARTEPLSTEAQVFGAVTVALIGGGVIKGLVDYLITE